VDDDVMPFNEYEITYRKRLSGGHLEAQIERFDRLWRIHFFIDADLKKAMPRQKLILLQEFIDQVVLNVGEPEQLIHRVKEKALIYAYQESGREKLEYSDRPLTFAKSDSSVVNQYPNGAPSMRSFLRASS
jgi:hypothetical protein